MKKKIIIFEKLDNLEDTFRKDVKEEVLDKKNKLEEKFVKM